MNDNNQIVKLDLNKTDWRSSRDFFQSLEDELRSLDDKDEKYDFTWVGKRKAIIEAGAPINKTLKPDKKSSKNWDTTENLFIEGDNLDALKLLQESYLGKVKMIYIDPPYNTGKDFVYHDNFKANLEEYDEATEYKDEEGNIQFRKNEKSNGRYHSDWLSMMYPRLKLARNLLTIDGLIFVSISDDEHANLKKIFDEIFGEDNFIGNIIWNSTKSVTNTALISVSHTHNLVYSRDINYFIKNRNKFRLSDSEEGFSNPDNDPRGPWKADPFQVGGWRPNQQYTIVNPNTGIQYKPNPGSSWKNEENRFKELLSDKRIVFGSTGNAGPQRKRFLIEALERGKVTKTLWDDIETTTNATQKLKELFEGKIVFDNPKPISLIDRMLQLGASNDSIVLDFFSGSCTTAHAVMQLNAEDGGKRKWIMVQLPEETPEDSEARKAGYKNIPEIARERIRRAGDKIAKEHPDAKVDYGFRSLVIADTNYKEVYKPVSEVTQESLLDTVDNIKEDRTELDLLFGVLTQLALELNRPVETRDMAGSTVYLYDYLGEISGLVACFSDKVSEEAIRHIASLKPLTAVFRDSSFEDSQAKVNLAEHFRVISPDTKVRVI